jgi:ABC-type branched-subunit amino acid transport system substrate-binding protein
MRAQTAESLSAEEQRGKDIYFGVGAGSGSGIKALVGIPPTDAPPTLLACANCHGRDGKGKSEGQVVPSDITWNALTKPYGVTHASGRTHQPYTERLLVRAICMGIDPAGHELNTAMPRFQMSREDIHGLTLYLKRLGRDGDAGMDDSTIRIATIVPGEGPFAAAGRAASAVLTAYFDAINKQGGIYNRRLELTVATLDEPTVGAQASIETLMSDRRPFAMVGGAITGAETEIAEAAERNRIPFINPLATFPEGSGAENEHTFYLLSGAEHQARALINYSTQRLNGSGGSLAIVHAERVTPSTIVSALQEYGTRAGWKDVKTFSRDRAGTSVESLAYELDQSHATHILLMGDGHDISELAAAIARTKATPVLLVPGSMATDGLLMQSAGFADRLFLALPSLPSDQTQAGHAEYRALAEAYRLPTDQMASQIAALGSAKVLTHVLKLAGRALSREKVVAALEGLYDFDTGLTPRVAFNSNRRIGASGAYIVTVDPDARQFRQVTGWIGVE